MIDNYRSLVMDVMGWLSAWRAEGSWAADTAPDMSRRWSQPLKNYSPYGKILTMRQNGGWWEIRLSLEIGSWRVKYRI